MITDYLKARNPNATLEDLEKAIKTGIDINKTNYLSNLALANFEEAEILLKAGASVKGFYADGLVNYLMRIGSDMQRKIDLLIQYGFDINHKNSEGENILFGNFDNKEDFMFLLDKVDDIFLLNKYNENIAFPLMNFNIKTQEKIEIFELLEKRGINLNHVNSQNRSILFNLHFDEVLLKYLIDKKVDVNIIDNNGDNVLLKCDSENIALLLLEYGKININIKNNAGENALNSLCCYKKITQKLLEERIEIINFPEYFEKNARFTFDLIEQYYIKSISNEKRILKETLSKSSEKIKAHRI